MLRRTLFASLLCIAAESIWLAAPAQAEIGAAAAFRAAWQACPAAASRAERRNGLPRNLLAAIGRAESGRWDALRNESIAWPWTVTSGSENWRFDTKAEAIGQVRALQATGRRNIDVGCFQINLMYHPDAFSHLEEALDPTRNAAYAGRYLRTLYAETGDWTKAAAHYHSREPERARAYAGRVFEHWRILGAPAAYAAVLTKDASENDSTPATNPDDAQSVSTANASSPDAAEATLVAAPLVPIDHAWTERLNRRFREVREAVAPAHTAAARAAVRHRQLSQWRETAAANLDSQHDALIQRVRANQARAKARAEAARPGTGFAANRSRQLEFWRARIATPDS